MTGGVRLTLDRAQVTLLAAVDAHGLNMDASNGDQVGALLLIEVVQVGLMLEVVGVALAILNDGVGDHIVIVLLDVQSDALVGQDLLADLQDLAVGAGWQRS